jgi:acyl dehydratase
MRTFEEPGQLRSALGETFGSAAISVTQAMIDAFANATDDRQWIHVDPQRARSGPYGTTIAHGYLTLSLVPAFLHRAVKVAGADLTVNYGVDRVRFPAPVPTGTRLNAAVELRDVRTDEHFVDATYRVTITSSVSEKPHCVADVIVRYMATTPVPSPGRPGQSTSDF